MGQSQPTSHQRPASDVLASAQHRREGQQQHQQQHPTSAAFSRAADFTDASGDRLLTEAGFTELFSASNPNHGGCLLPPSLIRAVWLMSVRPGREFLTAKDFADLYDRLEAGSGGGGGDAQRMLLLALLSMAETEADDGELAAADIVLESAWLSRRWLEASGSDAGNPTVPDCFRRALAHLLKPPPPPTADEDNADSVEAFDARAEMVRLVSRHMPQLMSEATSAILACLRAPLSSPAFDASALAASAASPRPPADVLEPWLAWTLACQLPQAFLAGFPTAQLLYDTERQLRSPSQLAQLVFDYGGPTLLLAAADDGRQFCCAADRGYREAWQAYGEADCRLTQLAPELKVLLSGGGLVYANLKASVGVRGVAMGRGGSPVLLIGPELDSLTVFGVRTRLARLRAIGLGEPDLVAKLRLERERDQRFAAAARDRKLRLVQDGSAGWEQNVDRQLLEWGGVRNAGNNAQVIEGREAELGTGRDQADGGGGPSRLLKPEF